MTEIFAHRGSKGTHPENTLPAFREAVLVGADGIELDVHLTKDQQLVVIHDEDIERTTNGRGLVADLTLAELKQVDAGSWFREEFAGTQIPSLIEVITLLNELHFQGTLNIELKTDQNPYPGIEEKIVSLFQQTATSFHVMYSSFNYQTLKNLHQLDHTSSKGWITYGRTANQIFLEDYPEIDSLHPDFRWFLRSQALLMDSSLNLRPWTVNHAAKIKACILQDASAIHTDYPELAIALRDELRRGLTA